MMSEFFYAPTAASPSVQVVQTLTTTGTIANSTTLAQLSSAGGAYTATVPSASVVSGQTLVCQKTTSDFNVITLSGTGLTTTTLNTIGESVTLVSNGTNWILVRRDIPSVQTSYTPGSQGLGTITPTVRYWRSSEFLTVRGVVVLGTRSASEARINLPSGLSTPSGLPTISVCGNVIWGGQIAAGYTVLLESSVGYVTFGFTDVVGGGVVKQLGNAIWSNSTSIYLNFNVPISGWNG